MQALAHILSASALLWFICLLSIGLMGAWPELGVIVAFFAFGALAALRIRDMGIINFILGAGLLIAAAFYFFID